MENNEVEEVTEQTEEEVKTVTTTLQEGIVAIINSEGKKYFECISREVVKVNGDREANQHVNNICALLKEYKDIYKADVEYNAKLQTAEMEQDTKLAIAASEQQNRMEIARTDQQNRIDIAKLEANSRLSQSEIETKYRLESEKMKCDAQMAVCDADNATKASIANAELTQKRIEMIEDICDIGIKTSLTAVSLVTLKQLVATCLDSELNNNFIVGRATGSRVAMNATTSLLTGLVKAVSKI